MSRNFLESHEFREQVQADAERDERLAEIRDRRHGSGALPEKLESNEDFMHLYRSLSLGCSDGERRQLDTLISLAFGFGDVAGMARAIEKIRGGSA